MNPGRIIMIRPVNFYSNPETALNNAFQNVVLTDIHDQALKEFNEFVSVLKQNNVDVLVYDDSPFPETPDSIFPNNWISIHENGEAFLYPMFACNRRLERKIELIEKLHRDNVISRICDL